jgi:hypothetical protein
MSSHDQWTADVMIDLKEAGLRHAPGETDGCGGMHYVEIDLEGAGLHHDEDCPRGDPDGDHAMALQRLHEIAHPQGTLYVEYCREPECLDAW